MTTSVTVRNGIDVDQLLQTIEHVKEEPVAGEFTFRATSTWHNGTHNTGQIGSFVQSFLGLDGGRPGFNDEARRWALGVGNPVRHADLTEGEEVVDLGCGAGLDSLLAAAHVAPGGTVTGIDFLDAMIRRGRRHAELSGCENVSFVRAEIDRLPFDDASTDVVISNGTINLAARKSRVFAEAKRILRPGGRLSVSDLTIKEEELPSEVLVHPSAWAG